MTSQILETWILLFKCSDLWCFNDQLVWPTRLLELETRTQSSSTRLNNFRRQHCLVVDLQNRHLRRTFEWLPAITARFIKLVLLKFYKLWFWFRARRRHVCWQRERNDLLLWTCHQQHSSSRRKWHRNSATTGRFLSQPKSENSILGLENRTFFKQTEKLGSCVMRRHLLDGGKSIRNDLDPSLFGPPGSVTDWLGNKTGNIWPGTRCWRPKSGQSVVNTKCFVLLFY